MRVLPGLEADASSGSSVLDALRGFTVPAPSLLEVLTFYSGEALGFREVTGSVLDTPYGLDVLTLYGLEGLRLAGVAAPGANADSGELVFAQPVWGRRSIASRARPASVVFSARAYMREELTPPHPAGP